ncbi:hypothetical protein VTL71DRAFT_14282 [Oculimacula yallundae]|uniref:SP-RING-type domain-containing protein n=1 Tax=Oculimacula yallundae TaxID=86028 RepID=A0ABR4CI05_9HELO
MNNRRLVSRSRMNDTASPAPARRQQSRASETPARQPARQAQTQIELPPYEPPICALSEEAQNALDSLSNTYDYSKYKKHLGSAKVVMRMAAAESNDRLLSRKENFPKLVERRRREGVADEDRSEGEAKDETVLKGFERANDKFTVQAEEAMRELIDYSDELSVQDAIIKEVVQEIANAPAPRRSAPRRRRDAGSDDEDQEEEDEPPAADSDNMSAVELLRQAKEDRAAKYAAQSKRARYADNNDYKTFKQILHDAQNPNNNANVPHPSTWFPEENDGGPGGRRRRNNTTDNTNNGGDSDSEDEVIIASASESLKCPLTLQYFKYPVTNSKCKHTIDREALADYHRTEGRVYQGTNNNQKVAKCPTTGCDAMLAMEDYVKDELMARKVERAIRREKEQDNDDDDDDEDDGLPRGTQRNRPEQIDDDDDNDATQDVEQERQRAKAAKIKRERARSRGLSMAPNQPAASMDSD